MSKRFLTFRPGTTHSYTPKTHTVERAPGPRIVSAPLVGGELVPMGKSWGMRVRGDVAKVAPQVYRCPVHGEFEVEVPLDAVPESLPCPVPRERIVDVERDGVIVREQTVWPCENESPWAGSSCGIGHAAGEMCS